jgi:hypothetical protein
LKFRKHLIEDSQDFNSFSRGHEQAAAASAVEKKQQIFKRNFLNVQNTLGGIASKHDCVATRLAV